MKSSNIYTTIYEQQGIVRRVKPIWWAVYGTIIGLVCAYFFFYSQNLSVGWNAILLGMLVIGVFSLLTLLCYHTFGDRHFPYHQATRQLLEPTAVYYPSSEKDSIIETLENNRWNDLPQIKKSTTPQLILVQYSNADETVCYAQLLDGNSMMPVSKLYAKCGE